MNLKLYYFENKIELSREMFSIDSFELEAIANRHLFDYPSSTASELFLCNDNSTDSDLYSSYNSDQENDIEKM